MSTERYDPTYPVALFASDGIWTAGHIDGAAATWAGNMAYPRPRQEIVFHREDEEFHDGHQLYRVFGGVWIDDSECERREVELL